MTDSQQCKITAKKYPLREYLLVMGMMRKKACLQIGNVAEKGTFTNMD